MKKMSLLSSIFRKKKSLPKEEKQREEEEGPCTSYSHEGKEDRHGGYLDHQILSKYLGEYKSHSRAFRGITMFPQFIQHKEERRPCSREEIRGSRFLLSTFDGDTSARAWMRKLEAFFSFTLSGRERSSGDCNATHGG